MGWWGDWREEPEAAAGGGRGCRRLCRALAASSSSSLALAGRLPVAAMPCSRAAVAARAQGVQLALWGGQEGGSAPPGPCPECLPEQALHPAPSQQLLLLLLLLLLLPPSAWQWRQHCRRSCHCARREAEVGEVGDTAEAEPQPTVARTEAGA